MNISRHLPATLSLHAATLPQRPEPEKAPTDSPTDSLSLAAPIEHSPKLGSVLAKTAFLGVGMVGAVGGRAYAQTLPEPPISTPDTVNEVIVTNPWQAPERELDLGIDRLQPGPTQIARDTTRTRVGVAFNSVNDLVPDAWTSWLGGPEHKTPDGRAFDDDGWTAEVQLLANVQRGNTEWVTGARLSTITQPGSRYPYGKDYQGLRTDLAELIVQRNQRVNLADGSTLDYGLGGGLQAIGNVGGEAMQRGWHEIGPLGGRLGDNLQGHQTNEGFRVMPVVTGGIKYTQEFAPNLNFVAGGQTTLPVGNGLAMAGVRAGVEARRGPVTVEVGARLEAAYTNASELDFHSPNGLHEGWYGRLDYQPGNWGGFYSQLETGGVRNEPILTFGVRFGNAGKARLSPFW